MTAATRIPERMVLVIEAAHARLLTDSSKLSEDRVLDILEGICIDARQTYKSFSPKMTAIRNLALFYREMRESKRIQTIPTITKFKLLEAFNEALRLNRGVR